MISVILPTYNRGHTLVKAVQSVLQQSFSDLELIIIDDASTDNTFDIISKFNDKRIKYFKVCGLNRGANYARNLGIKKSSFDYVAFHDSDDIWVVSKLETQLNALLNSNNDIGGVFSQYFYHGRDRSTVIKPTISYKDKTNIRNTVLSKRIISTQTLLLRKKCFKMVGTFDETIPRLQDWEFCIRLVNQFDLKFIEQPLVHVYFSEDSITNKSIKNNSMTIAALNQIISKDYSSLVSISKLPLSNIYYMLSLEYKKNKNYTEYLKHIQKSILIYPYLLRYYFRFIEALCLSLFQQ